MNISLRLYKGIVHIPTSYVVQPGRFFFEGEPVRSLPAEQTEGLRQAALVAIDYGNPPMDRDKVRAALADSKSSAMLAATGAKSWHVLDRQTEGLWSLVERDGVYQIRVDQPMEPRGWHEDKAKRVEFPPGTPINDVVDRLIAMIQERAQEAV